MYYIDWFKIIIAVLAISLFCAAYAVYTAITSKPKKPKKCFLWLLASVMCLAVVFAIGIFTQPIKQPEKEKTVTELYVVVEVHKDYISIVGLNDNKPLDLGTANLASSDYYVNDVIDDTGNVIVYGQSLEKAQAQIPSIGTAVSLPSS